MNKVITEALDNVESICSGNERCYDRDWDEPIATLREALERAERIEQAARAFLNAKDRVLMPYDSEARSAINALFSALDGDA